MVDSVTNKYEFLAVPREKKKDFFFFFFGINYSISFRQNWNYVQIN